jgi:hypothetical protein
MLVISALAVAYNVVPKATSLGTWTLNVYTSPPEVNSSISGGIMGYNHVPIPCPDNWVAEITAPTPVYKNVSGYWNTQWEFDHWEINGTGAGSSNPIELNSAPGYIYNDKLVNLTAVYKTAYYLRIITPFSVPGHALNWYWWWAGQTAHADLAWGATYLTPYVWWGFDYWTGDASGTNFANSNGILMDSAKTATAVWYLQYYLKTAGVEERPGPGTVTVTPPSYWVNINTTAPPPTPPPSVALSAPWEGDHGAGWRYKFDHWDKDGHFYTTNNVTTVTMDGPHNMTAHYIGQDYLTFVETDAGGLSHIDHYSGWYNWSQTYTFNAYQFQLIPIPGGPGIQFRWAWWNLDGGFFNYSQTITYHPVGPGHTFTARFVPQYWVKLDTDPTGSAIGSPIVKIKGSDLAGIAPLKGWFDSGSALTFIVPNVAQQEDNHFMWMFDNRGAPYYRALWKNQAYWGPAVFNSTDSTWYSWPPYTLTGPLNITACYRKYYYVSWDTSPLSNMAPGLKGNEWDPEGDTKTMNYLSSIAPNWVFRQSYDTNATGTYAQGIGINPFTLDGGSLKGWHNVIGEYWNVTTFYLTPSNKLVTAPKACTYFDIYVYAANFLKERNRDLFAVDFQLQYNSTLIKLAAVEWAPELNALWGAGNWYVAKNQSYAGYGALLGWDVYWFAATALRGAIGFQGSKPVVKLTFHIELDPCYPTVYSTPITWAWYYPKLSNSTGSLITPELSYDAHYTISAPEPIVQIDLSKTPITKNAPPQTFEAYVNIKLGIKVKDFTIVITYPSAYIDPINVTFGSYLPGPGFLTRTYVFDKAHDLIFVTVSEDTSISPLAYGDGTLFIIEFRVIQTTWWMHPDLTGTIAFVTGLSYLSVLCPAPLTQWFTNRVITHNVPYCYEPYPGDLNFDGHVDVADLRLIAMTYGTSGAPGPYTYFPYDVNGDGNIDILDLVLVALHYGLP